jgi:hypothetical protein
MLDFSEIHEVASQSRHNERTFSGILTENCPAKLSGCFVYHILNSAHKMYFCVMYGSQK